MSWVDQFNQSIAKWNWYDFLSILAEDPIIKPKISQYEKCRSIERSY